MKFVYILLFQLLVLLNISYGSNIAEEYNNKVTNSFMEYYKYGIDEKLYLQTDKPYYSAGENIWLKGYVLNAITHHHLNLSNYIYVELLDRKGEIAHQVKIKRDSTYGFNGYIKLEPKMSAGSYSLRAYTKWMSGSDNDLFFEKVIDIISPIPDDSMVAQAQTAAAKEAMSLKERREDKREEDKRQKDLNYDLQFFPEGGGMVAGVPQMVAFKAVAEDGISIEVRGEIFDAQDQKIAEFESMHNGMGFIQLNIPAGQKYYAKVKSSEGVEKRVNLPISSPTEVAIKVSRVGSNIFYQALASDPAHLKGLSVIIHSRGRIITTDTGDMTAPRRLPLNQVYAGVSVISLVNEAQEVISERIFFKKPTSMPTVDISPNKKNYKGREKATVALSIKGSDGRPAQGQFAVSVTDDKAIAQDSSANNALSYLLLSSEIKGYVEKPGLYFLDNSRVTDSKIDLLMMTQGWRRFELQKILDPEANHRRNVQYEDVVQITGEVKGFFGNNARKPKLSILCQHLKYLDIFELDASNKFNLIDVNIPDSAVYVISAQGRFGGNALTLRVQDEQLPYPKAAQYPRQAEVVPFQFINQSQEKFYFEGGLTLIELESVVVTAEAPSKIENAQFASNSSEREDLEGMGGMSIADIIATAFMGITIQDEEVYYRGGSTPVKFFVDGMEEDYIIVSLLTADIIEQIDFFDSTAASGLYFDAGGGVFNITLLDGASIPMLRLPNIVNYAPLGYQRVEKFYHPQYDSPARKANLPPDFRTTIFWSGDIAPDANGDTTFDFYTADKPTTYRIIVEGVTTAGEICHSEVTVERDN